MGFAVVAAAVGLGALAVSVRHSLSISDWRPTVLIGIVGFLGVLVGAALAVLEVVEPLPGLSLGGAFMAVGVVWQRSAPGSWEAATGGLVRGLGRTMDVVGLLMLVAAILGGIVLALRSCQ